MASLDVVCGELSLVNAQLSVFDWEGVLRRVGADTTLHVRALRLDENDLGGAGAALADATRRLERLSDLCICDAKLGGSACSDLLAALAAVPAFARTHAEVWAPIEVAPATMQGARLVLMRNGISDADLGDGETGPRLTGVVELVLSGNAMIGDSSLRALTRLAPSLRTLHLGRTGITGTGDGGSGLGALEHAWPLLDALAMNGTPMSTAGFERLCKVLQARARAVSTKKLLPPPPPAAAAAVGGGAQAKSAALPGGGAAAESAHPYFHLDLRGIPSLAPVPLSLLLEKMKEFSREHAK